MKPASILEKNSAFNFRDADGLPNFKTIEQVQSSFHPEEIVIMVNHFLMRHVDWGKVDALRFCPVPHEGSVALPKEQRKKLHVRSGGPAKPKLQPNVSLKDQLKKAAPVAL
jgi:hypothetical protein